MGSTACTIVRITPPFFLPGRIPQAASVRARHTAPAVADSKTASPCRTRPLAQPTAVDVRDGLRGALRRAHRARPGERALRVRGFGRGRGEHRRGE